MEQLSDSDRLVDYLVLVGPKRGVTFEPVILPKAERGKKQQSSSSSLHDSSWQNITSPVPAILCHFPHTSHKDLELVPDMAYFCQPEGCCLEMTHPKTHLFMLTDTETNKRTYGTCLTFPHLYDPHKKKQQDSSQCNLESDSLCIQEWGVLSVCILSRHPFFSFFAKCLKTLSHFMEHFGDSELSWNRLLQANSASPPKSDAKQGKKSPFLVEVEEWISNLLLLPVPESGRCGLEVELEVEPAVFVCSPSKHRLPLLDLPLHQVFLRVGVHTVIEIFKLVLSEQKVCVCVCE